VIDYHDREEARRAAGKPARSR
ncbi:MAG: hypothetical protein QOJ14_138, partial [Thermoleophilaceae bacterium]|nr:hypothetical protein [Thermoleophilaceae bacterium]